MSVAAALIQLALEAPERSLLPLPDAIVTRRPGWFQVITPSLHHGVMNEVACSEVDGDLARLVDETIAQYGGLPFRWCVLPGAEALAPVLRTRGFSEGLTQAMITRTAPPFTAFPAGITVEATDARTFTQVMSEGWGMADDAALDALHERFLREGERYPLLVARVDGVLAGGAALAAFGEASYFAGGVVLPAFRRRGVYGALVSDRLRRSHALGCTFATTHARADTSAPLLKARGWETAATFLTFRSPPQTPA